LLNDTTIRRETVLSVTYYYIELDAHDVLLAEGLPAESYLDTGNRGIFENAAKPLLLHPDFTTANDQARRLAEACAPFIDAAAQMAPIWRRVAQRGIDLGYSLPDALPTTTDPSLSVVINGCHITPIKVIGARHIFVLPTTSRELRIVSRHTSPSDVRPWIEDRRRLGVMIRVIRPRRDGEEMGIPIDRPMLGAGWWDAEQDARSLWRWTNGDAHLSLPEGGLAVLEIELAGTLDDPASTALQRAA